MPGLFRMIALQQILFCNVFNITSMPDPSLPVDG